MVSERIAEVEGLGFLPAEGALRLNIGSSDYKRDQNQCAAKT
jgi:hypothetical protein